MKIELLKPTWKQVFQVPMGAKIIKGRHGIYKNLRAACGLVSNRFGCYAWQSPGHVHYCGSFSADYTNPEYVSNLEGRFCNYWENHDVSTNKHIFDSISTKIKTSSIELAIFKFCTVELDNTSVSFADFCLDSDLVKAVEALLICHYRRRKQCKWNRT